MGPQYLVLGIQIHWIWIRILNFGSVSESRVTLCFLCWKFWKYFWRKTIFFLKSLKNYWKITAKNFVVSWVSDGEFLSSILHRLPTIYPIVTGVNPYSEYGSGPTKLPNTGRDPNFVVSGINNITFNEKQLSSEWFLGNMISKTVRIVWCGVGEVHLGVRDPDHVRGHAGRGQRDQAWRQVRSVLYKKSPKMQ